MNFRSLVYKTYKNVELRKKFLFTLILLIGFQIGCSFTLPGVTLQNDQNPLSNNTPSGDLISLMGLFGGGGTTRFSLFALGVSPYILATVIVQLLSADVIPAWARLNKAGEAGKKQLDFIARCISIVIALLQGIAVTTAMKSSNAIEFSQTIWTYVYITGLLTGGSFISLWFADRISEHGIGNGVSLIIFSGIVARIPWAFLTMIVSMFQQIHTLSSFLSLFLQNIFSVGIFILIIILTAYLLQSIRKIPIRQTGTGLTKGDQETKSSYLSLRINNAGVIPVIFASAVLAIPITITNFTSNQTAKDVINIIFSTQHICGIIFYFLLILAFTFFYAGIVIKPKDLAENLQKNGSFIPGVRQGLPTQSYLERILARLNLMGGLFLAFVSSLPFLLTVMNISSLTMSVGGTGMIIIIGVAINVTDQLKSRLTQHDYMQQTNVFDLVW